MLATTSFTNPVDLQVTIPLTLKGFENMGPRGLGHDWHYQGSKAYCDPENSSGGCSITAGKGIAVGSIQLNPKTNQIANFALHHFSYKGKTEQVIEDVRGYMGRFFSNFSKSHTYLFIIGDDQKTSAGGLLSDIRAAIEKHFGNTDCIRQQKLGVCKENSYNTIQTGILPDGTMRYSVFNR